MHIIIELVENTKIVYDLDNGDLKSRKTCASGDRRGNYIYSGVWEEKDASNTVFKNWNNSS